MARRLPVWTGPAILGVGLAMMAAGSIANAIERRQPDTAHERCVEAASTPGETGFAVEVCDPLLPSWRETYVQVYEDGSGVQWIDGREVRRFGDSTFVWACEAMGDKECGR